MSQLNLLYCTYLELLVLTFFFFFTLTRILTWNYSALHVSLFDLTTFICISVNALVKLTFPSLNPSDMQ